MKLTDWMPSKSWLGFVALGLALTTGCADSDRDGTAAADENEGGTDGGVATGDSGAGTSGASTMGFPGDEGGEDPSGGGDSGGGTGGAAPDDGDEPRPDDEGGEEGSSEGGEPMECDDQTLVELFLSPDDSNSMSSPVQAREAVLDNFSSIHAVPIRTWEFMNYYSFDYPAAPAGELLVEPSLYHDDTMEDGEYVLQIGIASEAMTNEQRPAMNVTLVLDESGSMGGTPMEMQKESCRALAASLKEGDTVSIVTWDTDNAVKLAGYSVTGPNDPMLLAEIEALEAGGGTDLEGGLRAGYDLAEQVRGNSEAGRLNRIVLISDGGANTGVTDEELIAEHAGNNNEDGIYMVGVGVGDGGTYNDLLMDTVTDIGKGASVFVGDSEEAWKIFGDDFVNTMAVAARDVQVKLDMPPGFEIVRFSGEEFSANPTEIEPQHIAPNDAMVFHQRLATCAPELAEAQDATMTITVTYKDALTFEEQEASSTMLISDLLAANSLQLLKGAAVFEYAEALKAYKKEESSDALAPAFAALDAADAALPGDADLAEIRQVLGALQ